MVLISKFAVDIYSAADLCLKLFNRQRRLSQDQVAIQVLVWSKAVVLISKVAVNIYSATDLCLKLFYNNKGQT